MIRRIPFVALLFCGVSCVSAQTEIDLVAKRRIFPEIGPGVAALKADAHGRYLVLVAKSPSIAVYDAAGARLASIPPAAAAGAAPKGGSRSALVYAEDFDITSDGRLVVADRGANAIKVFTSSGELVQAIPVVAPTSVAALSEGEIAVTSANVLPREEQFRLVSVFDRNGRLARDFGDPADVAQRRDLNRFLSIGRILSDADSNLYYAFSFLPEPTVRKFDRFGYGRLEIVLTSPEFEPAATAARREINRQDEKGGTPSLKSVVTAIGVDPATQEIWLALGNVLLHFDRDGNRVATYRTYTAEGVRVEADAIVIEKDRLLLAADPIGIYEFLRPDKTPP